MTKITRSEAERIAKRRAALMQQLKLTLIYRLPLRLKADEIADDTALFGTGLGLDSVDALAIAVAIEREFEITIADEDFFTSFRSLNLIADFILQGQDKRILQEQDKVA
jgi:acyl carrier protein